MKTIMTELVDIMNEDQVSFTEWFQDNYKMLIEKEKEQIIKAHWAGWEDAYEYLREDNNDRARQAEEYYNETYEQNEGIN